VRFVDAIERTAGGKVRAIVARRSRTVPGAVPEGVSDGG